MVREFEDFIEQNMISHDSGLFLKDDLENFVEIIEGDPHELRKMLVDFIKQIGFNGIPPAPKETQGAITQARNLPLLVKWGG